jgi:acid phosphatase (class A)
MKGDDMMVNATIRSKWGRILPIMVIIAMMAGCAGFDRLNKPVFVPELMPGLLQGYLSSESLPNSLALLPPPPAMGSTARAQDEEISKRSFALRDTQRWLLATSDARVNITKGVLICSTVSQAFIDAVDTAEGFPDGVSHV